MFSFATFGKDPWQASIRAGELTDFYTSSSARVRDFPRCSAYTLTPRRCGSPGLHHQVFIQRQLRTLPTGEGGRWGCLAADRQTDRQTTALSCERHSHIYLLNLTYKNNSGKKKKNLQISFRLISFLKNKPNTTKYHKSLRCRD